MKEISEILPRKAINLRKGEGSFIFIDLEPKGREQISLWVYMCDWVLTQKKYTVTSDSIDDAHDLSGISLGDMVSIKKDDKTKNVHINFSTGTQLTLSNEDGFYSGDDDYFMLFIGDSWVAKYSEKDGFSVRRQ